MKLRKFLIIQTAFIGDVVLATPIIEKIHSFFPNAEIDFLLRKGNEQLLQGHPYIHELLVWDKKTNKQKNLFALISKIRKRRYDKVINAQRFFATGLLTAFSGAKETIGFDKNPFSLLFSKRIPHLVGGDKNVHEILRNQELIHGFTDATIYRPKLYPSTSDFAFIEPWTHVKYITISPASVWFTKQFPPEQWILFIKTIPAEYAVYLLGGPGDTDLCLHILRACDLREVKMLAGQLSFLQSAALMGRAFMNYVNDSAPMHFASAMNAPVTAVYCSTIPGFGFGPLSDVRHIVEIDHPLYCRPCGLHGYHTCPEKHFRCALDIRTEQLSEILTNTSGHTEI